jgi:hypothetical protein
MEKVLSRHILNQHSTHTAGAIITTCTSIFHERGTLFIRFTYAAVAGAEKITSYSDAAPGVPAIFPHFAPACDSAAIKFGNARSYRAKTHHGPDCVRLQTP